MLVLRARPYLAVYRKTPPYGSVGGLLLCFFVHRRGTAPFTILFEFNFTFHQLLVLGRPIVDALAFAAGELYESILRHAQHYSRGRDFGQKLSSAIFDELQIAVGGARTAGRCACTCRLA